MIVSVSGALSWTMEGDYHRQRWTTWFLWKDGVSAANIHRRLAAMCGDTARSRRTEFDGLQRQGKWAQQVSLFHNNARLQSTKQTTQKMASLQYTVLPHPACSPDLVPSDCALFNEMKEPIRGRKFPTNDDLGRGACDSVCSIPKTVPYGYPKLPDSKGAQTLVGSMSKMLQCDLLPVISSRLITQMSVNHLLMTLTCAHVCVSETERERERERERYTTPSAASHHRS
jgi:hypothetical protein